MDTHRDDPAERQFYLTNLAFELSELPGGSDPRPTDLANVELSSIRGSMETKSLPLKKASERRWEALCFIELSSGANETECIVTGDGGGEVGRSLLRCERPREGSSGFVQEHRQPIETSTAMKFTAVYEIIEIPTEVGAVTGADGSLAKLDEYGLALVRRYEQIIAFEDLSEAVSIQRRAVQITPENSPKLAVRLSNLGRSLSLRADYTGEEDDADEAISLGRRAVAITSEADAALPNVLKRLALSLRSRFEEMEEVDDITEAISLLERAIALLPDTGAELPLLLNSLADAYTARLEYSADISDLSHAISCKRRGISLTSKDQEILSPRLNSLANSLTARFERLGNVEDISEAISVHRRLVEITPDGHSNLHARLNNFGTTLQARFQRMGELCDIDEAISVKRRAVDLTPRAHPYMPTKLSNLGNSLLTRFERTGDLRNIDEAISLQRESVELSKDKDTALPARWNNLGLSLTARFETTASVEDISEAVESHAKAVALTLEDSDDFPSWLNNLGIALSRRYEHTGVLRDIDEAISAQKKAVRFTPEGHAYLPTRLNNLGNSLSTRFERTGDLQDITEAISVQKQSVELTPEGHAYLPPRLTNLGNSFSARFDLTNDSRDIAEAISAQQRAVHLTPGGHAELATRLSNLGNSFATRFENTEEMFDIDEAISIHKKSVELTPASHSELSSRLNSLGTSYTSRSHYTDEMEDIEKAVESLRRAVELTSEEDPDLPARLNNLGFALQTHFERTQNIGNLEEAVSAQRRAVELTPDDHAELPNWLFGLGKSLVSHYGASKNQSDLDEAIVIQRRAVALTPSGHGQLSDHLDALAQSLSLRSNLNGHSGDLDESVSTFKLAATSAVGAKSSRLRTATSWARLLNEHYPQSLDIISAFDIAIEMIALLAGLGSTVKRRFANIQDFSGLPQEAAAAACRLGRPNKAVEWLEQGRCLVWRQLNSLRTPLDEIRSHDPELARRIESVGRSLEVAGNSRAVPTIGMSTAEKISLEDEARTHLNLAKEWDDLLLSTRAVPGLETFLSPSTIEDILKHLPPTGFVVLLNVHKDRCDAIVLMYGREEALHVPLPNLSLRSAAAYRVRLGAELEDEGLMVRGDEEEGEESHLKRGIGIYRTKKGRTINAVYEVLRSLWDEVAKPIIDALGISIIDHSSGAKPARIWWCPTGPLSFLPIHAAGIYGGRGATTLMDYVVSSYSPTVSALIEMVKRSRPLGSATPGLFLTSQPRVPGTTPIPGTTKEVAKIFDLASTHGMRVELLEGDAVDVDGCLSRMEAFTSVHLACHASQRAADPLQSRFRFHKGSLRLDAIMKKSLKNADLAFLSACQTSTGEDSLSDEAVHLAAGMLAAGYLRVVATMWSIGDRHAPDVACDFYEYLWDHGEEGGTSTFDGSLSAYGLHHAMQRLRGRLDSSERSLLAWIPYVHFGY